MSEGGNMIAMVCSDGLVVGCLKQFGVEKKHKGEGSRKALVKLVPKPDSEFEKCFDIGEHPTVVMCGLGSRFALRPVLNLVAEEVLGSERNCSPRPTISMISQHALDHARKFLPYDCCFECFVAGADEDIFGNVQLNLKYLNLSGMIDVPNKYIVGGQSELIRRYIGGFQQKDTDEAVKLIKYGFALAARNEPEYPKGYIEIRIIRNDGVVIKDQLDNLEAIVDEVFRTVNDDNEEEEGN